MYMLISNGITPLHGQAGAGQQLRILLQVKQCDTMEYTAFLLGDAGLQNNTNKCSFRARLEGTKKIPSWEL
jgi:hypothetical protein